MCNNTSRPQRLNGVSTPQRLAYLTYVGSTRGGLPASRVECDTDALPLIRDGVSYYCQLVRRHVGRGEHWGVAVDVIVIADEVDVDELMARVCLSHLSRESAMETEKHSSKPFSKS